MNEQQMRQMMEQMRKEMEAQYNQRLADVRLELKDPYQYRRQKEMEEGLKMWGEVQSAIRKHYNQPEPQPSQTTPQTNQPKQQKTFLEAEREKDQRMEQYNKGFNILLKKVAEEKQKSNKPTQPKQTPKPSEPIVSTPVIRGSDTPMWGMSGLPSMYGSLQMTPYRPTYDDFFQQYGGMMGSFGSPKVKQTQNPLLDAFRAGLMNRTFGG